MPSGAGGNIMPAWNARVPKVLFLCAEPVGMTVPKAEHVRALRRALDPWIEKTFERMADLAPWSYMRSESIAYPFNLIQPPPMEVPPLPDPEGEETVTGMDTAGHGEVM